MTRANTHLQVDDSGKCLSAEGAGGRRPKRLTGRLGTWDIVFTVLAYNAPLTTVIAVVPLIVSIGNGLSTPLALIAAAGLMVLFAVGFTAMTKHIENGGAFYTYITAGLGRSVGLGAAIIALLGYFFFLIGNYLYIGDILQRLFAQFGLPVNLPPWTWTLLTLTSVAILGYKSITLSAKVLTVALLCEVLLVVAWEVAIGAKVGLDGISTRWMVAESHSRNGSLGIGLLLAVTCFAGFEATAVFRDEAKDPDITVPRGTYLSIILMGGLFATAAYFFIVGYGPTLVERAVAQDGIAAPLNSIREYLGMVGVNCVQILLCSSLFAAVLALHNILSRYVFSLSQDRIFPSSLAQVHARHGSPHRASIIVSVTAALVTAFLASKRIDPYDIYAECSGMAGYVLLVLQILTSLAVIAFFRSGHHANIWRRLIAPLASLGALCWILLIATAHIDVVAGTGKSAQILIEGIYVAFALGIAWAQLLRKRAPIIYNMIGKQAG